MEWWQVAAPAQTTELTHADLRLGEVDGHADGLGQLHLVVGKAAAAVLVPAHVVRLGPAVVPTADDQLRSVLPLIPAHAGPREREREREREKKVKGPRAPSDCQVSDLIHRSCVCLNQPVTIEWPWEGGEERAVPFVRDAYPAVPLHPVRDRGLHVWPVSRFWHFLNIFPLRIARLCHRAPSVSRVGIFFIIDS